MRNVYITRLCLGIYYKVIIIRTKITSQGPRSYKDVLVYRCGRYFFSLICGQFILIYMTNMKNLRRNMRIHRWYICTMEMLYNIFIYYKYVLIIDSTCYIIVKCLKVYYCRYLYVILSI